MNRRPRGTPQEAVADVRAAMARLATGRPQRTTTKLTATNLATEAGMSRKQLVISQVPPAVVGGSQGPVVKSWCRASSRLWPLRATVWM